jgi:murein DD-endopeptidase MepM/ murein hydrolase activator NlpD
MAERRRRGGERLRRRIGRWARRAAIASLVACAAPAALLANGGAPPIQYAFVPIGGTFDRDVATGLFVDVDPAPGAFQSFGCGPLTYDGHHGSDLGLRSFAEKRIGVPVFAAADGMVTYVYDDDPDENVFPLPPGIQNNIVAIEHGGIESAYFHLATDSADAMGIGVGLPVVAGQQIGRVGSSGFSLGPHLHFENRLTPSFTVYEPFTGPCNPGPSGWKSQPVRRTDAYATDFGVTADVSPGATAYFPFPPPRQAQLDFAEAADFLYWVKLANLPAFAEWSEEYVSPDGTGDYALGPFGFGNPEPWIDGAPNFRRSLAPIEGTWRIRFRVNGQLLVDAPVEVVAVKTPGFNRPPEPVTVALDPPAPVEGEVVFCRVTGDLVLDDLDWDVVRFRYVWKVDGATVRDVVSAGWADALRRDAAAAGQSVACEVTPSDGQADGATVSASVTIGAAGCASGDDDADGVCNDVDNCRHAANAQQEDRGGVGAGSAPDGIGDACQCGDANGDGRVTAADSVVITRSLLQPPTATRTRPELCDVGGPPSPATQDCTVTDAVLLRRALLSPPTAAIAQVCAPATP